MIPAPDNFSPHRRVILNTQRLAYLLAALSAVGVGMALYPAVGFHWAWIIGMLILISAGLLAAELPYRRILAAIPGLSQRLLPSPDQHRDFVRDASKSQSVRSIRALVHINRGFIDLAVYDDDSDAAAFIHCLGRADLDYAFAILDRVVEQHPTLEQITLTDVHPVHGVKARYGRRLAPGARWELKTSRDRLSVFDAEHQPKGKLQTQAA